MLMWEKNIHRCFFHSPVFHSITVTLSKVRNKTSFRLLVQWWWTPLHSIPFHVCNFHAWSLYLHSFSMSSINPDPCYGTEYDLVLCTVWPSHYKRTPTRPISLLSVWQQPAAPASGFSLPLNYGWHWTRLSLTHYTQTCCFLSLSLTHKLMDKHTPGSCRTWTIKSEVTERVENNSSSGQTAVYSRICHFQCFVYFETVLVCAAAFPVLYTTCASPQYAGVQEDNHCWHLPTLYSSSIYHQESFSSHNSNKNISSA